MKPGDLIAERFAVERLASAGGMGMVYRAKDRRTDRAVAIKVLHHPAIGIERFAREAEVLARLKHESIVRYIAHGTEEQGGAWLAIEWLDGHDLAARLVRGPLGVVEAVGVVRRAASALGAAHAYGIVHRDIKPSNLFLEDGDLERVKILDFGVARLDGSSDGEKTRTGTTLGTPAYMAPEQARGERDVDARVDVFALGCVLFECLAGRPVFVAEHVMGILAKVLLEEAPRLKELKSDVPPALDNLVARMLSKAAEQRPADGLAVVAELDELASAAFDATVEQKAPPSLTAGEQRLLSIVLAQAKPSDAATEPRPRSGESGPRHSDVPPAGRAAEDPSAAALAATLPPEEESATLLRVRVELASYGAHVEKLADGSIVATLAGAGSATDQAARAARFSLALRALLPDIPMALATGRGWVVTERWPVGVVIDRAVRLLRESRARDEPPAPAIEAAPKTQRALRLSWGAPTAASMAGGALGGGMTLTAQGGPRPVRIDDVTAGLLDVRFDVGGDASGLVLHAEREQMEATRTLLGKPTPFVGRERELNVLVGILDECLSEPVSRAVLVTGTAGVGKSRLRYEFLRALRERDVKIDIWIARGDPMGAGAPFGMIAPAIRRSAGIYEGEPIGVRRQKLRARLGRTMPPDDVSRAAEFLGEMIGTPFPDDESVELRSAREDPVLMGDQMRRAWESFLEAETKQQPVVLVLEDMHWGDASSIQFLDAALRTLDARPFLVLALARPEVRETFPRLWEERAVYELRLSDLTKKASAKLVHAVLPDAKEEVVTRVVSQASGNAFYLEELLRAVAEGKGEMLPETVLAMVETRLQALAPDARRVLRAASVFGQVLWKRGVAALVGGPERVQLLARLDELVDLEVLARRGESRFPGETEYAFRQAVVREAAYAMLTDADKKLGHELAARWLEEVGEREPTVLAEHHERGGETKRAAALYRQAALQAREANDLDGAMALSARGIACGATGEALGELKLIQAEVHRWRNENAEEARSAEDALALLPQGTPAHYVAVYELAQAYFKIERFDRAVEMALAIKDEPFAPHEHDKARAIARLATNMVYAGKPALSAALVEKLDAVDASAGPGVGAMVHQARGTIALFNGYIEKHVEEVAASVTLYEAAGDLRSACLQRVNLGNAYIDSGKLEEAVAELRAARERAKILKVPFAELIAMVNLGYALSYLGVLDEARALEAEVVARMGEAKNARIVSAARIYYAIACCLAGDFGAAEFAARAAVRETAAAPPLHAYALASRARAELGQLRRDKARDTAARAMAIVDEIGAIDAGDAFVRLTFAEALYASGELDQAKERIRAARDRLIARAELIEDEQTRAAFLARIPEHAATLARARAWLEPT